MAVLAASTILATAHFLVSSLLMEVEWLGQNRLWKNVSQILKMHIVHICFLLFSLLPPFISHDAPLVVDGYFLWCLVLPILWLLVSWLLLLWLWLVVLLYGCFVIVWFMIVVVVIVGCCGHCCCSHCCCFLLQLQSWMVVTIAFVILCGCIIYLQPDIHKWCKSINWVGGKDQPSICIAGGQTTINLIAASPSQQGTSDF